MWIFFYFLNVYSLNMKIYKYTVINLQGNNNSINNYTGYI